MTVLGTVTFEPIYGYFAPRLACLPAGRGTVTHNFEFKICATPPRAVALRPSRLKTLEANQQLKARPRRV